LTEWRTWRIFDRLFLQHLNEDLLMMSSSYTETAFEEVGVGVPVEVEVGGK
jgi:hypothetical protein